MLVALGGFVAQLYLRMGKLEADVARFRESDGVRSRLADLRKPIVGMPAVIRAMPKGELRSRSSTERVSATPSPLVSLKCSRSVLWAT